MDGNCDFQPFPIIERFGEDHPIETSIYKWLVGVPGIPSRKLTVHTWQEPEIQRKGSSSNPSIFRFENVGLGRVTWNPPKK